MANLTITVDESTLKKARIRALTEGTSVNEVLGNFLDSYAGASADQIAALEDILEISHRATSGHRGARRWTREELYDRK